MLRAGLTLFLLLVLGSLSGAAERASPLKLDVQVGWGEALRPGRWTPIYVTTSDPAGSDAKPRAVQLELQVSQPQAGILHSSGTVTVGARPRTFTLYAPPRDEGGDEIVVVLRDVQTGRMLALWPEGPSKERRWARPSVSNRIVAGFIGESATRLDMLSEAANNRVAFVTLSAGQLPDQAIGFDELDLLILDRPDLSRLPRDRQQAVVDWIKSGGTLLLWPGSEPGGSSPLADVLPCRVGEARNFPLPPERRQQHNLTGDKDVVAGMDLRPRKASTQSVEPLAEPIPMLPERSGSSDIVAYTARVGFGRITVVPIDPGDLHFASVEAGRTFYQDLTRRLGVFEPQPETSETISFGADNLVRRQDHASAVLETALLRENPTAASGWSNWIGPWGWVALAIGLFVGPVEAVALRICGRRGFTPVTAFGCLLVLAAGAALLWNPDRKQLPRLATIELIDQADDQVIARQVLATVSAARDQQIRFMPVESATPKPDVLAGMWELPAEHDWTGRGRRLDLPFSQSLQGLLPGKMQLRAGRPLTIKGELGTETGQPLVSADLAADSGAGARLRGRVRNISTQPLSDLRIVAQNGFAAKTGAGDQPPDVGPEWRQLAACPVAIPKLGPGEAVDIDLPLQPAALRGAGPVPTAPSTAAAMLWPIAGDMNARRSWRVGIEAAADCAVIYAKVEQPPRIDIDTPGASIKRETILRALVPLR